MEIKLVPDTRRQGFGMALTTYNRPKEQAADVLARIAKVLAKPGIDRKRVFQGTSGKPVYAYFVYSKDPSKVVREDVGGHQVIGRFVGGRFRATVPGKGAIVPTNPARS